MGGSALTTTGSLQSASVPADWNNSNNSVEGIGTGGTGSRRQASSTGGTGGGGGAYGRRSNLWLPNGGSYYYYIPSAITPSGTPTNPSGDAWFNDLNLFLQSDTLSDGAWAKNAITIGTGLADPFGTSTATRLIETAAYGSHNLTQQITRLSGSVPICLSVYALPQERTRATLLLDTNSSFVDGAGVTFDLSNGTIGLAAGTYGANGWTNLVATIKTDDYATGASGNGWYKICLSGTAPTATTTFAAIYVEQGTGSDPTGFYTGDITKGLRIAGPSLNFGTSTSKPYTPTTTMALYSLYLKSGTSGTLSTAGSGGLWSASQGGSGYDGGGGFKTASGLGGGGGGAGGPRGIGATATSATGGTGDGGNTAAGTAGSYSTWNTLLGGTYGAGGGGSGPGTGVGADGGAYGAGGSGSGSSANVNGGAGKPGLFVLNWTPSAIIYNNMAGLSPFMVR